MPILDIFQHFLICSMLLNAFLELPGLPLPHLNRQPLTDVLDHCKHRVPDIAKNIPLFPTFFTDLLVKSIQELPQYLLLMGE